MQGDPDGAHDAIRLLLEQSMSRIVGAFEHYTAELFATMPMAPHAKVKRGSFQRLDEASSLWREAVGKAYDDILSAQEWTCLIRLIQQRHLLTHANGIVDADYVKKSGDATYVTGQRIVIREGDVRDLADLVGKLGAALKTVSTTAHPKT